MTKSMIETFLTSSTSLGGTFILTSSSFWTSSITSTSSICLRLETRPHNLLEDLTFPPHHKFSNTILANTFFWDFSYFKMFWELLLRSFQFSHILFQSSIVLYDTDAESKWNLLLAQKKGVGAIRLFQRSTWAFSYSELSFNI